MAATSSGFLSGLKLLGVVLKRTATDWSDHHSARKGAALAYYTLFSMAPVLVLVLAVAGAFYSRQAAQGELFNQIRHLVGETGAATIEQILSSAATAGQGLIASLIAGAVLIAGATTVFVELKECLDEIWQAQAPPGQPSWLRLLASRLAAFGVILALGLLLIVSLAMSAALALLEQHLNWLWLDIRVVLAPLAKVLNFAVSATLFAAIFKLLPRPRLAWRDVWIGALGTAALFALGKYAIGLYIGHSSVTGSFGAAGSLVALLLWMYYSAQILLLGAEFTHQYALAFGSMCDRPALAASASKTSPLA